MITSIWLGCTAETTTLLVAGEAGTEVDEDADEDVGGAHTPAAADVVVGGGLAAWKAAAPAWLYGNGSLVNCMKFGMVSEYCASHWATMGFVAAIFAQKFTSFARLGGSMYGLVATTVLAVYTPSCLKLRRSLTREVVNLSSMDGSLNSSPTHAVAPRSS